MPCSNRDDESVGIRDQVIKVRVTLEELALIDLKRRHISRSEFLRNLGLDRKTRSVKANGFLRGLPDVAVVVVAHCSTCYSGCMKPQ